MNTETSTTDVGSWNRPSVGQPAASKLYWLVAIAGLCQFIIALTGLPDLMGNEHRIAAYALDAIRNGHWMIQRDFSGEIASKPPLLTWLVTLGTFGSGNITRFTLYWPTVAATIGVALVLLSWGKKYFSWQTGLLAALIYLFSWCNENQMFSARYDGLLAFAVTLAALAAFRAWTLQKSWDWFWLAVALGTMIKGPVALLLGAAGLLAVVWEKRTGHSTTVRGSHWRGILWFLLVCGGWFFLAYLDMGQPLTDKMLGRELVGHITGSEKGDAMFMGFYKTPTNVVASFAPWSVLVCLGLWRVWRQPSPRTEERQLERFLACWFVLGLLMFCIASHQRGRLIMPLIPAAAFIAGRELALWLRASSVWKISIGFTVIMLALLFSYHHGWASSVERVKKTVGMHDVASVVSQTLGEKFPLVHVAGSGSDMSFALQFYLTSASPLTSMERAVELLQNDYPAFVSVINQDEWFDTQTNVTLHEIARWPQTGKPVIRVVGNHLPSEAANRLAFIHGPLLIRMEHLGLVDVRDQQFTFAPTADAAQISIQNQSQESQSVTIRILRANKDCAESVARRVLSPGEDWFLAPGAEYKHGGIDKQPSLP